MRRLAATGWSGNWTSAVRYVLLADLQDASVASFHNVGKKGKKPFVIRKSSLIRLYAADLGLQLTFALLPTPAAAEVYAAL